MTPGSNRCNRVERHRGSIPSRRNFLCLVIRIHAASTLVFLASIATSIPATVDADRIDSNSHISSNHRHFNFNSNPFSRSIRGDPFDADWEDLDVTAERNKDNKICDDAEKPTLPSRRGSSVFGFGREFSLFESSHCAGSKNNRNNNDRGGDIFNGYSYDDSDVDSYDYDGDDPEDPNEDEDDFFRRMERYWERRKSISSISSGGYNNNNNNNEGYSFSRAGRPPFTPPLQQQRRRKQQQQQQQKPILLQNAQNWWKAKVDPKLQSLPKIVCRIEPSTTLKLRKTFRPLKTIIRLGADYNTQQGIWQFKSSWEDAIIGGKITLSGNKELQLTKSWQMSVGGVEDLVTRLRLRATINLQTFQAYAKVGFRTERLTPIDVVEGFTILKRLPLDGSGGNLKLEVKANVALPEPEIEYRTESQARSLTGMGDIEVSIDEMNLLLDY